MEKLRIAIFLLLILLCQNIFSKDYDSLIHERVIQFENSLDSIKHILIENEKRTNTIENELNKYADTLKNPIQIKRSVWDSIANLFAIVLSIFTLIYVVKADRINSLFGSYRGKKRYQTLQKEITDLNIKLKDVKSEFDELINSTPDSFIKNGKPEINRLQEILSRIEHSDNFTYPGDIQDDRQQLIYEIRNGDDIIYYFNNYVVSRIGECNRTISRIETELNNGIKEAREIRFGENNSVD